MAICAHCGQRKGKRRCPALEGWICTLCCGLHRGREIACSAECPYFVEARGGESLPATFTRATEKMMAVLFDDEDWCRRAATSYLRSRKDLRLAESEQTSLAAYMGYGFVDENGERFVDHYLREHGKELKLADTKVLAALREAWFSLFEVEAVRLDEGLELRDLVSDEVIFVREKLGTHDLVKYDVLLAWVTRLAGDDHVLTGGAARVPPPHKTAVLGAMRAALTRARKKRPDASTRALSVDLAELAFRTLVRGVENAPRPKLVTTNGEELVFCEAHFDVGDPAAAMARLEAHPDIEAGEEQLDWVDRSGRGQLDPGPLHLGSIRLKNDRIVLETKSRERLERGKRLIGELLGELVTHRLDSIQDVDAALDRYEEQEAEPPDGDAVPPEVQAELTSKLIEEHLMRWIDEQIPALDGRTPRESVRSAKGRARVLALLREQEHITQRMPGGDRIDYSRVYRELGLER